MSDSTSSLTRITADTNILVSGFIRAGTPPNQLLRAWVRQAFRMVTSAELRAEVAEVLQRPRFTRYRFDPQLMTDILEALAISEPVEPLAEVDLPLHCRDPKDDMVLACALAAQVDYIVTGDRDLHELAGHAALGSIHIVTVRDFLVLMAIDPDKR